MSENLLLTEVNKRGMTLADVARAMDVTPQRVGAIVNSRSTPRPGTLARFLRAIGWEDEAIANAPMYLFYADEIQQSRP